MSCPVAGVSHASKCRADVTAIVVRMNQNTQKWFGIFIVEVLRHTLKR